MKIRTQTETDQRTQRVLEPDVEAPSALVRQEASGYVRAIASDDMEQAIAEYRRIQAVLDRALPDCLMRIQGRSFRKKAYWRAVCTAFNLTVELHEESIEVVNGTLVVLVIYRATAPNGRVSFGDGACTATEKRSGQDSIHNVRSHAHTRAFNRAVSNLVGFGEVSAEEVDRDGNHAEGPDFPELVEVRMMCGRAIKAGWTAAQVREILDAHDATFVLDKGVERIAGMPPEARASAIRLLGASPPKKAGKPEPEAPAATEAPADAPTYPPHLAEVLAVCADLDPGAVISFMQESGVDLADPRKVAPWKLGMSKDGSKRAAFLASPFAPVVE